MVDYICVSGKKVDMDYARRLSKKFDVELVDEVFDEKFSKYFLLDKTGLSYFSGKKQLKGDFLKLLPRVTGGHLAHEIILKAVKPDDTKEQLKGVDCTAGMGEDSFLLAAAGFEMELFEHNPITATLLADAIKRAKKDTRLSDIARRMSLQEGESVDLVQKLSYKPDLIYLDPMFPEKKKSSETKNKLQILHTIEAPCSDEQELLKAAIAAGPKRIVIKRPPEGPFLSGIEPSYSIKRKAVRFDCIYLSTN